MNTPDIFQQLTSGMADPAGVARWFKQAFPEAAGGSAMAEPSKAWIASVETLLKNAETLRIAQLDAIHRTRDRTTRLAEFLGAAHSPAETGNALQSYAQDNMTDAMQYWTACRDIMAKAEREMLSGIAAPGQPAPAGAGTRAAKPRARTVKRKSR